MLYRIKLLKTIVAESSLQAKYMAEKPLIDQIYDRHKVANQEPFPDGAKYAITKDLAAVS